MIERGEDEQEHIHECYVDDCSANFVGMTPDDVRQHIVEDHDQPLGELVVFPTDEAREREGW